MKVAILGGGISGLSAAWFLLKKEPRAEITLFEKESRIGGSIESKEENGFLFELGPRTFQRGKCPHLLEMIQGLSLQPIFQEPQPKFLWYKNKMRRLSSFWPQFLRAALQDLVMPRGHGGDETIEAFAIRRMGKRAAALFFDSMTKGVYGGDIQKLSLQASFPFLFEAEQRERSIVKWMFKQKKGEKGLFTLEGGMNRLIDALAKLPLAIHLNSSVEEIRMNGVIANNTFHFADLIISALPGLEISRITRAPLLLRNQSLTVVNFGFSGEPLPKKGFGYLIPTSEKETILGQIWDAHTPGQTKLSSIVVGENPLPIALDALKRHLGITVMPNAILSKNNILPQYDVGHISRIKTFEKTLLSRYQGKLKLVGNYLSGASIEACISRSFQIIHTN